MEKMEILCMWTSFSQVFLTRCDRVEAAVGMESVQTEKMLAVDLYVSAHKLKGKVRVVCGLRRAGGTGQWTTVL
jgi:hypothetical protein